MLITKEEYDAMPPKSQGYVTYYQADWEGSKIPKVNPYAEGTPEAKDWNEGNFIAMLQVQDSEE